MLIMRVTVARHGCAILSAAILLLGSSTARATVLVPGATVGPPLDVLSGSAGTLLDSVVGLPFSTGDVVGTLTAAVVRNALGTLDFYYQITNTSPVDPLSGSLSRNSNSLFNGFATDVFYREDTGGLVDFSDGVAGAAPSTASLSPNLQVVSFNFLNGGLIGPGETSRILVIRTSAFAFTSGISSVIDGGVDSVDTFAPDAVPEPASLVLLSSAFAAAAYMARNHGTKKRRNRLGA
jgi:hypothetical protein